jgi:hypothetical protein
VPCQTIFKAEFCKFLCLDEDSHIVAEDITFTCQDVDYCEDYEYRCERIAMPMILYGLFCHINLGLDPDLETARIRILQHSGVNLNDFSLFNYRISPFVGRGLPVLVEKI